MSDKKLDYKNHEIVTTTTNVEVTPDLAKAVIKTCDDITIRKVLRYNEFDNKDPIQAICIEDNKDAYVKIYVTLEDVDLFIEALKAIRDKAIITKG